MRRMIVTVGTSLFDSATWDLRDGMLPSPVPGYETWVNDESRRRSPESRRGGTSRDERIRRRLREVLDGRNAEAWSGYLPPDLLAGQPAPVDGMRYSAELATILQLYESEGRSSLGDFLLGLREIHLLADPEVPPEETKSLALVAATHLSAYLNAVAGDQRASVQRISGISSVRPSDLQQGLEDLTKWLDRLVRSAREDGDSVDLVVSGGYKLYGIYLAPFALRKAPEVRLIYTHERGEKLVLMSRDHFLLAGPGETGSLGGLWGRSRFGDLDG